MDQFLFFIDDKNGTVSSAFAAAGSKCFAWHEDHADDTEMFLTPGTGGVVMVIGGDFEDTLRTLVEYRKMTGETMRTVHALSANADKLLPLLGLYPDLTTEDITLVVPFEKAA